jgi:adenylosuccinate lyase
MFALGRYIGKKNAHAVVARAAAQARADGSTLVEALRLQPEVAPLIGSAELDALLDPAQYIGLAPQVVDRTVAAIGRQRATDPQDTLSFTHQPETNPS